MITSTGLYPIRYSTVEHILPFEKSLVLLEHSNIVEYQQKQPVLASDEPAALAMSFVDV